MDTNDDKESMFSYSEFLDSLKSLSFLTGVLIALSYWIVDTFIDAVILQDETFIQLLTKPDTYVISIRLAFSATVIIIFFIVGVLLNRSRRAIEALRSSEERFRALYNDNPLMLFTIDENGMVLSVNQFGIDQLGYPKEQLVGQPVINIFNEEDRSLAKEYLKQCFAEPNKVHNWELRKIHQDGTVIYVRDTVWVMDDVDGKPTALNVCEDITERKQVEKALIESENKYRTLFEQSADAILIIEGDKFVDFNQATLKMLGYKSKEELLNTHPSELSPEMQPDGRNSLEKANEILSTFDQGSIRFEWDHKRQNGEVFPVEVLLTTVPFGERKFLHVVWRDITERRHAEELLRESNERFRAAFADAAIGMTLVSPDHRIIEANQAYCNMLGYSKDELEGVFFEDITHPDDVELSLDHHHKLIAGEFDHYHIEKRYLHKQGHELWGHLSVSLVRDKDGVPLYSVAQIQDITERKQVEDELHQYQMQLRNLVSEITIAEEQERRRIAVELHDNIIQDLGLCKIKLGELVQRLSADDCLPLAEATRVLIEQTIRESRLLVFDLSLPILYDLGFEEAVKWLAEQTEKKFNISCVVQDDGQPKPMKKEMKVLLYKATRELMANVTKHAHAKKVNISIHRVNDRIDISVQDDGVGFDSAHIESCSREALKFGLFGIKERLNLMSGFVKISSLPDSGTTITLTAPLELDH